MSGVFDEIELEEEDVTAGAILSRLAAPQQPLTIDEFRDVWFHTDITFTVAGAGHAIGDPAFPGRIRGAFGAELLKAASPQAQDGLPCPWDPPCAFEALFRKQGRMEPGLEYPGPWVVDVDAEGAALKVVLRLFGFAADYAGPAAEAMASALAHRLDYAGATRAFFPKPQILSRRITTQQGLTLPDYSDELLLDFLSPVLLSNRDVGLEASSLITTFSARLAGLARWHDVELTPDRDAIRQLAARLSFTWLSLNRLRWQRTSSRQGKIIPMSGVTGRLLISGGDADMAGTTLLLAFAEHAHIGADSAYGCGRFELA